MKVEFTHLDKVLFPQTKITKKDLIDYYRLVSKKMIPLIKDRPISMLRYPQGITKQGFYQKNAPDYFPSWIKRARVKIKSGGNQELVLCQNVNTLLYLANQGCITPHLWLSRKDRPDYPDRMIFDLDPSVKTGFDLVKRAAKDLKKVLEEKKFKPFLMTTGSRGLHVVVPIKRNHHFNVVRRFARSIAKELVEENPKLYTVEQRIEKRKKRLFIDYLRNGYAQTAVAPFAVRALKGAPIAMPIDWKELSSLRSAQKYTLKNVKRTLTKDPWKSMNRLSKSIPKKA